jgi:hypothetical protein
MAIDMQKGPDRAKPNPASPYADADGIQNNASKCIKTWLNLVNLRESNTGYIVVKISQT